MNHVALSHGTYGLSPAGYLVVRVRPAHKHSAADAREAMDAIERIAGGKRYPVLVDLTHIRAVDAEARKIYAKEAPVFCTSIALLTTTAVGKLIGNFFLSIDKPSAPTRLFDDEPSAMAWLAMEGRLRKTG